MEFKELFDQVGLDFNESDFNNPAEISKIIIENLLKSNEKDKNLIEILC